VASIHEPPRGLRISPRAWRELVIEANDGIIATAGIVEGLVAADVTSQTVLISAAIALVVGSVSTAGARYTEAAFQRDAALSAVAEERAQIDRQPEAELDELTEVYVAKGLSPELAREVATELMEHDALAAHIEEELDVEEEDFLPPVRVALGVGLAYAAGATLPILITLALPAQTRVVTTLLAVAAALVITSYVGARIGQTHPARTVLRAVVIGVSTLLLALLVGQSLD
jgi:VIT1/CCC1 family predicted Fe2+/Mn2+ transporter